MTFAKPHFRSNRLIDPHQSGLLVIDLQEKLLPAIQNRETVLHNVDRLSRAASLVEVPSWASVQYSKGLGPLDPKISKHFPNPEDKLDFSAAACQKIMRQVEGAKLAQVVIVGIETHICILQSTLDLLASQYDVFVVADAVAARGTADHHLALDRMQAEGASIVTTESVMFEWCQTAANDKFKQVSALVRESIDTAQQG